MKILNNVLLELKNPCKVYQWFVCFLLFGKSNLFYNYRGSTTLDRKHVWPKTNLR